jgi:hypothetical protein
MSDNERSVIAQLVAADIEARIRMAEAWAIGRDAATDAVLDGIRGWCGRNGVTLPRRMKRGSR